MNRAIYWSYKQTMVLQVDQRLLINNDTSLGCFPYNYHLTLVDYILTYYNEHALLNP